MNISERIILDPQEQATIRLWAHGKSFPLRLVQRAQIIPEVGERIIVYGSPLGLENTVSDGIVSAIRDIPDYGRIIQITAPISPGSSGSPVLNMQGEVIGIASFQMVEGQNLNFAIPSEKITSLILTEENKISITEEVFGQESKAKKDSDYEEAFKKALYFMAKKEYEKALYYYEISIKTDDLSLKELAYFGIGICYEELGYYLKAIEVYKQLIRISPFYASGCYYFMAVDYDKLGNYIKAIESYKQAIRIDPDYADAYNNLGLSYYNLSVTYARLGLYKDAIEARKQAVRINPNDAMDYYNIGDYYTHLGLYKDAIEAFKQAIRIDPNDVLCVIFHFDLGYSYFLIGDVNSALNEYKILKELDIDLANELFDLIY